MFIIHYIKLNNLNLSFQLNMGMYMSLILLWVICHLYAVYTQLCELSVHECILIARVTLNWKESSWIKPIHRLTDGLSSWFIMIYFSIIVYSSTTCIADSNYGQLLPLAEEYQIAQVKRKCEEYLLTKPGSMELLVTAQAYGLTQLLSKCIDFARTKSFTELKKDPFFEHLQAENLINILQMRVQDLELADQQMKKHQSERDARLYGVINELASGYGNFCTECKSRKVNDDCKNCLKMFRQKVRTKCEEAKSMRSQVMWSDGHVCLLEKTGALVHI